MRLPNLSEEEVRNGLHAFVRALLAIGVSIAALYIIFRGTDENSKKWATGTIGIILGYYLK